MRGAAFCRVLTPYSRSQPGCSMRPQNIAVAAVLMLAIIWAGGQIRVASATDSDQYVGIWKGTWEGAGAGGRFDLTFSKGSDGKLAASVSVGTDMGDYNAKFSTVTVTGDKLAGAYGYPP